MRGEENLKILVAGSGLFGSVFAHEAAKKGHEVCVIEKREHIGGNIYTENNEGIHVHKYGAHIFHTSDEKIWNYIQQFGEFNNYVNSPIANYKGDIYNLPFNMNTFTKMWSVTTPKEAKQKISNQLLNLNGKKAKNLEEQALSLVGTDIYEKLIKEYTEKQWGRECNKLPSFIIKRLPIRFTYDNNYFNDKYQGIPKNGYTSIIKNMLEHPNIKIRLKTDYFEDKEIYDEWADKILFTGMIDEYFEFEYGRLEYRSLYFKHEKKNVENLTGNAVINYTSHQEKYTRTIEHKHFNFGKQPFTIITKEYPVEWNENRIPYYPINNTENMSIYNKYKKKASKQSKVIFGGRLGTYAYLDMDKIISESLRCVEKWT